MSHSSSSSSSSSSSVSDDINTLWLSLAAVCVAMRGVLFVLSRRRAAAAAAKRDADSDDGANGAGVAAAPDTAARDLCLKYLPCFLLFKAADWMQGPYLYDVYMSKRVPAAAGAGGGDAATALVPLVGPAEVLVLMLAGFGTSVVFSSFAGALTDRHGRRAGSIVLALVTVGSALSVLSNSRPLMYLGRVCGGASSSLLYTAPESWLNAEAARTKSQRALGTVFGWAYFLDGVVAVAAGQLANLANDAQGPTGPFLLSAAFSVCAALLVAATWTENYGAVSGGAAATDAADQSGAKKEEEELKKKQKQKKKQTGTGGGSGGGGGGGTDGSGSDDGLAAKVRTALRLIASDRRIQKLVVSQTAFEGAMYMFVCVWVPVLKDALGAARGGGGDGDVPASLPFGNIFSCFMICCMLGSTVFSLVNELGLSQRRAFVGTLTLAAASLGLAGLYDDGSGGAANVIPFTAVLLGFCVFEAAVGCYYPLMGTRRSAVLTNAHASAVMTLARIPLNLVVIAVLCYADALGHTGVLRCAAALVCIGVVHFVAF